MNTTVREANDRGYRCLVPADCCGSYFPEFHEMGLTMIKAQGGIFGWVVGFDEMLARAGCEHRRGAIGTRPHNRGHRRAELMTSTTTVRNRRLWTPGTGTPSSASAPTSWSTC